MALFRRPIASVFSEECSRAIGKGEVPEPRRLDGQLRWARPELDAWILHGRNSRSAETEDRLLADIVTKLGA